MTLHGLKVNLLTFTLIVSSNCGGPLAIIPSPRISYLCYIEARHVEFNAYAVVYACKQQDLCVATLEFPAHVHYLCGLKINISLSQI